MFDRLVESDSAAQFKPRKSYFMVSTVVVGILFLTAVVISLYAEDIDLGASELEISALLAPVQADAPEPPEDKPAPAASQSSSTSKLPIRNDIIARIDETPHVVPTEVSSVQPKYMSRPLGDYIIDPNAAESNGSGPPTSGANVRGTCTENCGSASDTDSSGSAQSVAITDPPPPVKKDPPTPVKPRIKSGGVLNGEANYLPKPLYPKPAQMVGAQGNVSVQVLIDEHGNVVSAKAVDGHPLLRGVAVEAAKRAKFTPTKLSDVPVKVTGIIVYKFSKN